MTDPFVTILVPIRNEEGCIIPCLASLCDQDYPADRMEILVLDGESTDHSAQLVYHLMQEDDRIFLLHNRKRTQAAGLNAGIRHARGEIVIRADAHALYGATYVSRCVEHLCAERADNVGGLQRGMGTAPFSAALAMAMSSTLGAGNASYRMATEERYVDTVWLGAWQRKTLLELGGFNEELVANEDYELNWRLRKAQGRVLLDPELPGCYFPRNSYLTLCRQYFRYGIGKVQMLCMHPESLLPRQLAAPLLVGGLGIAAGLAHFTRWPLLFLLALYLMVLLLGSLQVGMKHGWRHIAYLPGIYLAMHLAWGCGFYWGLLCYGPLTTLIANTMKAVNPRREMAYTEPTT